MRFWRSWSGRGGRGPAGRANTERVDLLAVTAVAAVVALVLLIALGSTVRVTNSGMGCSSWPLCNGQIGPIDRFHALMEQSHRYLATAASILVVAVVVLAWRRRRPEVLAPALAAGGALVVQVALGALTVLAHNAGWTVGLHLVCAEILLALSAVAAQRAVCTRDEDLAGEAHGRTGHLLGTPRAGVLPLARRDPWALVMVACLLATVAAGAVVVDGGAGGACPSWPLCSSAAPVHLVVLQLVHRSLAGLAGLVVLVAAWRMWGRRSRRIDAGPILLVVLLALQGAAGGVTAVLKAPAGAADVHLAMATLLWLAAVLLAAGRAGERRAPTLPAGHAAERTSAGFGSGRGRPEAGVGAMLR